jgi:CheY-like chemotaxis protein
MSGTLLLADDSITIQKVVELTFAETEHKVFAVGGGRDLLQRLPEIKPDIVLCDVVMPDMNGYEVCQILKSDPNTLHIPVVLLTGTFEPFDRDRAQAAGCDAIITKPFEARELIGVVEDLLGRVQSVAEPPAPVDYGGMGEQQGIPDGVPSLDFSTSGFDRMVPQTPPTPPIPEDGIDLTASSLGDSHPSQPISAPPELAEPEVPTAVGAPSFAFGGEEPQAFGEALQFGAPVPTPPPGSATPAFATEPPAPSEPFLVEESRSEPARDFFTLESAPLQETAPAFAPDPVIEPEPEIESAPVFAPEVVAAPPIGAAVDEGPTQRFNVPSAEPAHSEAVARTVAAAAAPIAAAALTREAVEHIARRVVELIPQPLAPAPLTAADLLTDEHVERIARRAAELVPVPPAPPTAAELLTDEHVERVARRAAELVPPPLAPPTAAELLTDEHVERVARRAAELVPPPPPPPTAAELLTDEHVERVAKRAAELVPPPAAPAPPEPLSDEQIEKIARRVIELAAPQLERIAWEVIPDLAEMLVRKRIAELEKAAEEES